jgi:catalase
VPDEIKRKQLDHFHKADPAYAAGVAKALDFTHEAPMRFRDCKWITSTLSRYGYAW